MAIKHRPLHAKCPRFSTFDLTKLMPLMNKSPKRSTPQRAIAEPTLRRLPWYLAHVKLQLAEGRRYISSTAIAREVGVEQAVVAKDLSSVDIHGRTRVGYRVQELVDGLEALLGFTENHRAVLIGVGNLGRALLSDKGLQQFGLEIVAGFDVDPDIVGQSIEGIQVYAIAELANVKQQKATPIAILTVPISEAQSTADLLVTLGFSAIWNFTPIRIHIPQGVVVQDASIYAQLALIFTRMREQAMHTARKTKQS